MKGGVGMTDKMKTASTAYSSVRAQMVGMG